MRSIKHDIAKVLVTFLIITADSLCWSFHTTISVRSRVHSSRPTNGSGHLQLHTSYPLDKKRRNRRYNVDSTPRGKRRRSRIRQAFPLRIAKTFFEGLESKSGKDYEWILPLGQPVSAQMKYVSSLFSFVFCTFDDLCLFLFISFCSER